MKNKETRRSQPSPHQPSRKIIFSLPFLRSLSHSRIRSWIISYVPNEGSPLQTCVLSSERKSTRIRGTWRDRKPKFRHSFYVSNFQNFQVKPTIDRNWKTHALTRVSIYRKSGNSSCSRALFSHSISSSICELIVGNRLEQRKCQVRSLPA